MTIHTNALKTMQLWLKTAIIAVLIVPFSAQADTITRENIRIQVLSPSLIRMEYSPSSKFIDTASVSVVNRDDWPPVQAKSFEDGEWIVIDTGKLTLRYKTGSGAFNTDNLSITWTSPSGGHTWKPGDKDDQNLGGVLPSMDGCDKPVTTPGALSRNGYFFLDDSRSPIWDAQSDWIKPRPEKDNQDWFFLVYEQDYKHGLSELSKLLGPNPMVPRYVLGAWFSSRAAYPADEWQMIADQFREESLPLDMIILDSASSSKIIWGGYDRDKEQMPDMAGFLGWMKKRGLKVSVNEHYSAITPINDSHFNELRDSLGLPADTKEIGHNLADKKYSELFMNLLHKPLFDQGLAFWWQDGAAGAYMEGLDPMMWTRHIEYIGSEKITGKRSMIFCRLGSMWGAHRYGSYFTGDMGSDWNILNLEVPATVQGGNSLVAWMNNDCGGIWGMDIGTEVYCRFLQFGSMSPILRLHSIWGMRLPWEYGKQGMETYRRFVGLRYALIPYIYTYGRICHETGQPLVRGMYIEYPKQESSYSFKHQYMFGRELLVAPITASGNGNPAEKDVFLPGGDSWFDYFTGDIYTGGRTIKYTCPIERMPLFVRSGSIIPMAPPMDYSEQKPVDPLTIDIYAGNRAEFKFYEDDGTSLDYRKGSYAWTPIVFDAASQKGSHQLTIGAYEGRYKGQPKSRRYVVKIHGLLEPSAILMNGKKISIAKEYNCSEGWRWDRQSRVTTVFLNKPSSIHNEVILSIENAGTFDEAFTLQRALNFRAQVRQVRRVMKVAYSTATGNAEIKKQPRMIRELNKVESKLNETVTDPRNTQTVKLDFKAMKQQIIQAITDHPFESERIIPEEDEAARKTTERIRNMTLSQENIDKIISLLVGPDLPATEEVIP